MSKFLIFVAAICMYLELMFFGFRVEQYVAGQIDFIRIIPSVLFVFLNLITIEMCNKDIQSIDKS